MIGTAVEQKDALRPEDTICVSITAVQDANGRGDGGARKGVAAIFNGVGQQIDELRNVIPNSPALIIANQRGVGAKPAFDLAQYAALVKANGGRPNDAAIELQNAYTTALETYKGNGGMDMDDVITASVLAWAEKHHGIYTTPGDHLQVDADQVQVRPSVRIGDGPQTFNVVMAPVWG